MDIINKIDVHIIKHPLYDRTRTLNALLAQLSDEPVNVHLVDGEPYNIGSGRCAGFNLGNEKYVSYLDDDDVIIPGIFHKIIEEINKENCSAYCTSEIVYVNGEFYPSDFNRLYYEKRDANALHHIAVFQRAAISLYLNEISKCKDGAENVLWYYLLRDSSRIKHIPYFGYVWRMHNQNSKNLQMEKDSRFFNLGKQIAEMARIEGANFIVPGNRYLTPEEMQQCQNQFQMLQSFLKNLELSYPA